MLKIKNCLIVEKHKISTKFDCKITINKTEFKEQEIDELPTQYQIPPIFDIYYPEKKDYVRIVLPYNVIEINKTSKITEDKNNITIEYEQGDTIIDHKFVDKSMDLNQISRILNGGIKVAKSPETILTLIHNGLPASDLVHYEVIISEMFRDSKGNLSRLSGKYDEIWGMKKISKNSSWKSALSYQDFNRGVKNGLVSGKSAEDNVLEKILDNKFDDL